MRSLSIKTLHEKCNAVTNKQALLYVSTSHSLVVVASNNGQCIIAYISLLRYLFCITIFLLYKYLLVCEKRLIQ